MKKNVLLAALAILAAASCQKTNVPQSATGNLIVQLGEEPVTKAADNSTADLRTDTTRRGRASMLRL